MPYTEEELEGLTDEERAALLDDEEQDGEGEGDAGADDQADDEAGDDEGDDQPDDEADDAGDGDGGSADAEDGDQSDDAGQEEEAQAPAKNAPILVAEAPEKAQERLQEIADEKKSLRKQYDDGDLTFEDYESKVESLDDERLELKLALNTAETAARMQQQQEINAREAEINGFLAEVGIPRDPKNLRFATLDVAVRIVANDEANSELSAREILGKAYELCVEQGTLQSRSTEKKTEKQPKPEADKPAKPAAAPRKPAPPTLAKVPASAPTDAEDGSRFAYLDRLDPVARETAFAKLSPADQEAYLQQA